MRNTRMGKIKFIKEFFSNVMRKNTIIGLIVFITLFSLALFNPKEIFAGTHSCRFSPGSGCTPSNINCSSSESPDTAYCQSFTAAGCNNAPATNCLLPATGCKPKSFFGCGSGYTLCGDNTTCCNPASLCSQNSTTCQNGLGICRATSCITGEMRSGSCSSTLPNCCMPVTNIPPGAEPGDTDPTCPNNRNGINTAIGCIDFQNTDSFIGSILKWGVGISGGIAFLLILTGAFSVMTSSGNPERLKDGQSIITSAVSGLILLILCIFVLKFIGIDILGLNTFGFGP